MRKTVTAGSFVVALAVGPLIGSPSGPQHPVGEASQSALDALSWMAGLWGAVSEGLETEEYWLPPKGGVMLGVHRDVGESGRAFFEYLRIEETPEGAVYLASPRGAVPTPFRLVESGERRVVFANPEHDFPQRISYWLDEEGALWARAEAGEKVLQWRWTRLDER